MEIRHRKQWLTGKMILELWDPRSARWVGAGTDEARLIENLVNNGNSQLDEALQENEKLKSRVFSLKMDAMDAGNPEPLRKRFQAEIDTLRIQLSEAQDKLREYREAEERRKDAVKEFQDEWNELKGPLQHMSDKFKKFQEREESGESDREFREEIERWIADRLSDPYSSISQAMAKHFALPTHAEARLVKKSDIGYVDADQEAAQPIPHHGPGLSEAEDAMRDASGCKGSGDQWYGQSGSCSLCGGLRGETYVPGKGGIVGIGMRPAGLVGKNDPINPSHYKRGGLEAIDVIRAATEGLQGEEAYCTGNAIKYLFRWKEKGGKTDLSKARWYINRLLGDE